VRILSFSKSVHVTFTKSVSEEDEFFTAVVKVPGRNEVLNETPARFTVKSRIVGQEIITFPGALRRKKTKEDRSP
jgi:uncharacterized protein YcnI